MELSVYKIDGTVAKTVTLNEEIFGITPNDHAIYLDVKQYLANQRQGTSKGKGFQGVVKRHGFAGVGGQTHGQHNRLRHPGSLGACSWPSRVFKGMRMAGHMGNQRVTVINLEVIKVMPENNLIVVKGSVPGAKGSYVIVED